MDESLFAAHSNVEEHHWWFRGRRTAIRALGLRLVGEGDRVVDVGCGTGADIAAFPPVLDRHGIDRSATAIAYARRNHPGVDFQVGTAPAEGAEILQTADLVLLCDVLEHIEHDRQFLVSLLSTMKPGAHLLMTVPAGPRLWSPRDETYGHYRRYTRSTLSSRWTGAPARSRLVAAFNRRLYPLARVARLRDRLQGRGREGIPGDLGVPWAPLNRLFERILGGETAGLVQALESGEPAPSGRAVSLLAVLERVESAPRGEAADPAEEARHG